MYLPLSARFDLTQSAAGRTRAAALAWMNKYPIESPERPLAEGIITNHATMSQFRLEPDQVRDVIADLKTLERWAPALRSSQGNSP
jgi:hypothetical protein